ncbi:DUF4391 domain-containing protein [Bifidobacterium stellenboschense]|uniref:Tmp1 n=1 Tax=Bifidobacterium stellenboschense TaxID=762211 RepID=A0A087DE15_9BIFI|nr:DUF4391 domain-containing protein [Bifidobacterium stellenboschense]KFI93765.1 hypothetical protein BSTEL_2042 [Bifidobacterium stellenboschense]
MADGTTSAGTNTTAARTNAGATGAASCGTVTALELGLPERSVIPAAKGTLPKALFAGKGPISNTLKQHLVHAVASIHVLALLRPANAGVAAGARIREILVLGLRLNGVDAAIPTDVIEHVAAQRPGSGVLFVCVRDGHAPAAGGDAANAAAGADATVEQCALAVRRKVPGRPGHTARYAVHVSDWSDPRDLLLEITGDTMDDAWESLCSQAILGTADHADLDARLIARDRVVALRAQEAKLVRDHARAKNPAQRNEAFAKLAKVRAELKRLGA